MPNLSAEAAHQGAPAAGFLADLKACIGEPIGTSAWARIDQARIDDFARATGDFQFVHVDPVRAAAEAPFGGTIAHGFLTLAMIGTFAAEALPSHPALRMCVNMGADKVRLLAPVRVNERIRGHFVLTGLSALPENRAVLRARVSIEAETACVVVLTAELAVMLMFAGADDTA